MIRDLQDLAVWAPAPHVTAVGEVRSALHVVDLDAPVGDLAVILNALQARTSVVVGVTSCEVDPRVAAVVDLVISDQPGDRESVQVASVDQAVAILATAVQARPRAALVLGGLLRQTALLPVAEGLVAEASSYSTLLAGPEFARWLDDRGPARPPRTDDLKRLEVNRTGDVLRIRLTRVVRRNAFDAAMRVALSEALLVALLEPSLSVELTGAGPVFSAGGDLDEFGSAADPATAWVVRTGDSPAHALARLGDRTVARVQGACAGAGVELPAFAGHLIADPAATFRLPEHAMGLLPGAGGTVSLTRRIGRWRTLWMGLTGVAIDTRTALDWGLVDAVEVVRG